MVKERTMNKLLGATFVLMGIFFFVVGLLMIMIMGYTSALLATLGAGQGAGPFSAGMILGWIFAFITFIAGLLCIISAVLLVRK